MSTTIPTYLTYETIAFTKSFYSQKLADNGFSYNKSCEKLRNLVDNFQDSLHYNTFWVGKQGKERGQKFFKENTAKGDTRTINAPNMKLRGVCKEMTKELNKWTEGLKWMTGFTVNCSVYDNAMEHEGCRHLVNIDLKDFFHQFNKKQIETIAEHLFNWNKHTARKFALMVTFEGKLVQGNPISPIFTNLIATHLDIRINKWCRNFGWTYTRYADDITISSKNKKIKSSAIKFLIENIIKDEGLAINDSKVTVSKNDNIEVTGMRTGLTVAPKKKKIKKKIKFFQYLQSLGILNTDRLNKEGEPISINFLIQGYKAWLAIVNSGKRLTTLNSYSRTKHRFKVLKRNKLRLKEELVRVDYGNGKSALIKWNPIKDTTEIFRCKFVTCERYATTGCNKTCKYHSMEYIASRYLNAENKLKQK